VLRVHRWDVEATAAALGISRTSRYGPIECSGLVRSTEDLGVDETRACLQGTDGDLDVMIERWCVSKKALRRRIEEPGLV
jgi:hypothetical protein